MRKYLLLTILLLVVLMGAMACGSARRGAPVGAPVALTDSTLIQGEAVFMRFCNHCHPGGRAGLGLALNNKPVPAFLVRFQVRHGLGVMPSFDEDLIPPDDLKALARYVIALRHAG